MINKCSAQSTVLYGSMILEVMPLNYYQRLGCKESASYEEIKQNFQDLVLKFHPDKQCQSNLTAVGKPSEEFCLVMEAWNTLRDEKKRKIYDSVLLTEKCDVKNAVFANLLWSDMDFDGCVYSYMCRCGDMYELETAERTGNEEISVQCNGCSLEIVLREGK